ncbi:MAG: TfuA-like protein [Kiloniellales bacterium]
MSAYVFLGPTLPATEARSICEVRILPPVRQGDLYRLVEAERPAAVGIVDGAFQHVPAVWHKEILWAMKRGVYVVGAASMGALRAAELEAFGMKGVGAVFGAYRDGVLAGYDDEAFEDDDEVAVIHGPPETGYLPLSEALVNIRVTLRAAEAAGVLSSAFRRRLAAIAKATFYQERSYDGLIAAASKDGSPPHELEAFAAWLPECRIDQKRADARFLFSTLKEWLEGDREPARNSYRFVHTTLWQSAIERLEAGAATTPASGTPDLGTGVAALAALVWYFEDRLGQAIPHDLELYARAQGYRDHQDFRDAVARDYRRARLAHGIDSRGNEVDA